MFVVVFGLQYPGPRVMCLGVRFRVQSGCKDLVVRRKSVLLGRPCERLCLYTSGWAVGVDVTLSGDGIQLPKR